MGLAAGQARLLSITSRKSDCEFQSMRLSHQKIALSRELADLSNEYQNSLDQTKLIYDYYGTGDTNTPLTYNILMTPSALNDYMPITLTDSSGRVTLDSKYAAAARAAGIPQEGLGTLPSETMRNAFIAGLAASGAIEPTTAETILGLPYNQAAGFGGDTTVATVTESGNITDLIDRLNEVGGTEYVFPSTVNSLHVSQADGDDIDVVVYATNTVSGNRNITLADLLSDKEHFYLEYTSANGELSPVYGVAMAQTWLQNGGFLDWIYNEFSAVLAIDDVTAACLEYAKQQVYSLIVSPEGCQAAGSNGQVSSVYPDWSTNYDAWRETWLAYGSIGDDLDEATEYDWNDGGDDYYVSETGNFLHPVGTVINGTTDDSIDVRNELTANAHNYMGFVYRAGNKQKGKDGNNNSGASLDLNNIVRAFLTFFADRMEALYAEDANANDKYHVNIGLLSNNSLVTDDNLYQYTWAIGSSVSSEDLGQATFYDALFNQICANGWTENNNIDDKDYLQQMLQSGMLFISKPKDDGYYYQANYATDSYIKEIADETYISQAEAKYNTEKAKLNAKEETLDLKMKNLDTEISSLTTEYDTVKNTISKNIEKSFKRYNA